MRCTRVREEPPRRGEWTSIAVSDECAWPPRRMALILAAWSTYSLGVTL
jgi:hypothetical protein